MLGAAGRSIRRKLFLVVLATTFAALLVAGAGLSIYELVQSRRAWGDELQTQAHLLARATAPALAFGDVQSARDYLALLGARPEIVAAAIYNANGKLYASYTRDGEPDSAFPRLPEADGSRADGRFMLAFQRIVENDEILGSVYIKADYELARRLGDHVLIVGGVMSASLLVALLLSVWLQRAVTQPILGIAALTRRAVESRDFTLRVEKTTDDEIGVLVDSFNGMLAEVGRRTDALEATNRRLEEEVAERERADEGLRLLAADLERRVADRTAQLESANRELEGFSYSVSHDLRAPLRAVVGFANVLEEDYADRLDDEGLRLLRVVQSEARRMGQLIDELLAFSRLGRKEMLISPIDMTELARSTYEHLAAQHEGHLPELQLGALPKCQGDRVLLGQVWANLLSNALKFSSKRDEPRIEVSAASDGHEHIFFVRDNGAGFDPRFQAKLFGVFQRLHSPADFPGTGVGLALVQRIVNRHGGRVWAEGRPGEGATFYYTLPKERADGSDPGDRDPAG
jgi:signal transduction histidine kinase